MSNFVEEKVEDVVYKIPVDEEGYLNGKRVTALLFHTLYLMNLSIAKVAEKLDTLIKLNTTNIITEDEKEKPTTDTKSGDSGSLRKITAKFDGKCPCGTFLKAGWTIYYDPNTKTAYCSKCAKEGREYSL